MSQQSFDPLPSKNVPEPPEEEFLSSLASLGRSRQYSCQLAKVMLDAEANISRSHELLKQIKELLESIEGPGFHSHP